MHFPHCCARDGRTPHRFGDGWIARVSVWLFVVSLRAWGGVSGWAWDWVQPGRGHVGESSPFDGTNCLQPSLARLRGTHSPYWGICPAGLIGCDGRELSRSVSTAQLRAPVPVVLCSSSCSQVPHHNACRVVCHVILSDRTCCRARDLIKELAESSEMKRRKRAERRTPVRCRVLTDFNSDYEDHSPDAARFHVQQSPT
jgi:hypothetical protein